MPDRWIDAAVVNHKGKVRSNNEDNYSLNGERMELAAMDAGGAAHTECADDVQFYAVCDGMGGEAAGEEASFAAVDELKLLERLPALDEAAIRGYILAANQRIVQLAQKHSARTGTTLTLLTIDHGQARATHIGDSRIYLLRGGALSRLTKDHSEVQRLIDAGEISAEDARIDPRRHVINRYLGMPPTCGELQPELGDPSPLQAGDAFLLCSDGLTDLCTDADILGVLQAAPTAAEAAQALVDLALSKGGVDNVTVLVARYCEPPKQRPWKKHALLLSAALSGALGLALLAEWLFRVV